MSKPIDRGREEESLSGLTEVDPSRRLRASDGSVSRVDTLTGDFARLLGKQAVTIGQIIGSRYRLLERLGGGAMGDVFVAENLTINARVAVKLLKPELLEDAMFRERFQREAQAIAAIDHPNVARFFDLIVGDPTFLVMEYVRGTTLSARLRVLSRLPLERAVAIGVRLCWALAAAHAVGVVHRDLKPANVILTSDVEHGEIPKLIDFGLAKLASPGERSLTRAGQLIGTPHYMSPEQIAGRKVGACTDVYALGCLLYEMVSGRPPFAGDDDFQILYKQVHEPAEPLRAYAPEAPAALEAVVARALAKNPEERYPTMAELAAALEAAVETARPKAPVPQPEPAPARSRQRALVLASIAVVVLGFGGGYAASRLTRKRPAAQSALFVLSEPAGALVEVDGKPLPQTTPAFAPDIPAGPHVVRIQRVGTAPVVQTVDVRAGERAVVQVTLPPATHRIQVRSLPDGAAVYLDRRLVLGDTPTSIEVTDQDFHELRIEKMGYQTLTQPITPDDNQPTLTFTLAPQGQPRGTLMVDANDAAEVWIDDVNTGYTTPTLGIEVSAGTHVVELRASGVLGRRTTVKVEKGQTVRVTLGTNPAPAPNASP